MQLEKIIGFIVGAILIFYLALQVGSGDFFIPIIFAMLVVGTMAFFALKHNIWLLIPIALINPVPLGFLPIPFKMAELAVIFLLVYLFFVHAAMRHYTFSWGPVNLWLPALIICLIIAYHQSQGGLGLRAFGSAASGARRHIAFLIAMIFFVTLVSIRPKNWELFRKLPGLYLCIVVAGAMPVLFCVYFPTVAIAMGIFGIFANISELMNFYGDENMQRVGLWGMLGLALQFWLVSRFPMSGWLNVRKLWIPTLSLVALLLCVFSGFRNQVVHYIIITSVAAMLSLRWRALLISVPLVAALAFLILGNGHLFELPQSMQRSMSFLPGNWDASAKLSAESSSNFRKDIRDVYLERYARNSPWFGSGYTFSTKDASTDMESSFMINGAFIDMFVRNKDFHIGWISLYDSVGVVGSVMFLWFWYYVLVFLRKHSVRIGWDRLEPIQIWVICYLLDGVIGYFTVFGGLDLFMVQMMFGAGLAVVVFEQMPPLGATAASPEAVPSRAALPRRLEPAYAGPFNQSRLPGRPSL